MYLIIFEDGSLYTMIELTKAELEAHSEGVLDIVVYDDQDEVYQQYVDGEFKTLIPKEN